VFIGGGGGKEAEADGFPPVPLPAMYAIIGSDNQGGAVDVGGASFNPYIMLPPSQTMLNDECANCMIARKAANLLPLCTRMRVLHFKNFPVVTQRTPKLGLHGALPSDPGTGGRG